MAPQGRFPGRVEHDPDTIYEQARGSFEATIVGATAITELRYLLRASIPTVRSRDGQCRTFRAIGGGRICVRNV